MSIRYRYWALSLAAGLTALTGCRSPSFQDQSRPEDAAEKGEAQSERIAEAHAHYAAGVVHEVNDEPEAALEEYYKAAMGDPDDESLVLSVSRRYLQIKEPEKALDIVSNAAVQPNATGPIFARLGLIYAQMGKTEQAIAAGQSAIRRAPASLSGYQNLFLTYVQNKHEAEALKLLEEASKQPKPDAEFLLGLSELYANYGLQVPSQRAKTDARAVALLNRAAKLKPTNPQLKLRLADGLSQLGAPDKAAELYLELLNNLPDRPLVRERVHAKLAEIYLRGSDHKRALEQLQAVVRDDPTNPQAYYWLGRIAYLDRKPAEAAEHFSKTILLSPEVEDAYYDLADAQIQLKKPDDALATLEKARHRFPQNFEMEVLTAMALGEQKSYAQALEHYTSAEVIAKATDTNRLNATFYFELGATSERKGDIEQAEKYFNKSLSLRPEYPEAQNYLGYMLAEHGLKLDEARQLIEKAVKAEPKNAAYLDSLGWVLFKLNQSHEALDQILKAVELSKEPDATVYDHLGDIYAALSQPERAKEAWRKSLSLEANEEVRKKVEAAGK